MIVISVFTYPYVHTHTHTQTHTHAHTHTRTHTQSNTRHVIRHISTREDKILLPTTSTHLVSCNVRKKNLRLFYSMFMLIDITVQKAMFYDISREKIYKEELGI